MNASPEIISGLRQIADDYDALICDIWGVVHNGVRAYDSAVDALRRYRADRGPVVLLTNAPRPASGVEAQLPGFGVPRDCYDAVVTSGGAAREHLSRQSEASTLPILHLGPERDHGLFQGLNIELCGADKAAVVLCSGLFDDDNETPEHYRGTLAEMKARELTMICANPDLVVQRGGTLVHCAGGLARAYEELGGKVAYYGKPHAPIYGVALQAASNPKHPLVIGDGLETDIRGANMAELDALFVTQGIHAHELGGFTPENVAALLERKGMHARAAIDTLKW
jgi:HAD superfamily hydrolase (TIGR01459 family)